MTLWLSTVFALFAFAGNSVFCRLALLSQTIDPVTFTVIRVTSAVLMLTLITCCSLLLHGSGHALAAKRSRDIFIAIRNSGSWLQALFLFIYAIAFSVAYITLETGIGALLLFGSVQLSIVAFTIFRGEKLKLVEGLGIILAMGGFVYLLWPNLSLPSAYGTSLMILSGIAWSGYTLFGKGSKNPLLDTTANFIRALPIAVILLLLTISQVHISLDGALLAAASGAITSGIGYTVWYIALRGLSSSQAGVVQLLVPVFASLGGVLFANEPITTDFIIASLIILSGVALVTLFKERHR